MVKQFIRIKSKYFSKRELVLAITTIVVAFSFSSHFAFAAQMKINDEDVAKIKTFLNIVNTASNFGSVLTDGGSLMAVLKTAVKGGQTATDVTYGLLVLSAINEMEFMDLIISQDYKDIEKKYFTNILDERTKLTSYWKGVGFDIPRIVSGKITGPMAALTLNTFEMTDKVISILTEFETLKKGKQYDGLWRYFDERRNGESHKGAWELAEPQVGWAANSISFRRNIDRTKERDELEQQFVSLWEKWGPYATPFGINKQYKEQVKSDLRNTLASAIEENTRVQPVYAKEPSLWERFVAQLADIKNAIVNLASKVNPFSAGPVLDLPSDFPVDTVDNSSSVKLSLTEADPQSEKAADVGSPPISELEAVPEPEPVVITITTTAEIIANEPEPAEIIEATTTEEVIEEPEPIIKSEADDVVNDMRGVGLPSLCRREEAGAARQYRVLINGVAWMGDKESANHEWIELKNIWGMPINLSGWQIQDKDKQIKIVFGENDILPEGGLRFLERSKDYTGALNNTNEALYLFDSNCQLEDEILANPKWPAGDNSTKEPMKRFDALHWYSGDRPPDPSVFYGSAASAIETVIAPAQQEVPFLQVVINEIAWAGTKANSADEWMELYNNSASSVDLTGWKIKKDDADWIVFTTSTIPAKGYYLLERTDDSAVSNVSAGQFFTGSLNNTGHKLELRDSQNNLIDSADFSLGWPAGNASPSYISMERIVSTSTAASTNWANNNRISRNGLDASNNSINGTPKAENSVSKALTQIFNSPTITEDATLTFLGSPYLVEGYLKVSGAKLIVEPGVAVKFKHVGAPNQNSFLQVENGILEAVGTASSKIVFTSSSTNPTDGDWDGIYLKDSTSTLSNITVQYGGRLHRPSSGEFSAYTYGSVYIDGGSAQISNSLIEKSGTFGLWLKNSTSSIISSTEFKDNLGSDHNGKSAAVLIESSSPTTTNSIFRDNIVGILTENYAKPAIKNNQFIQNTSPIQINNLLADISNNTFDNNSDNGVFVHGFGFSQSVQEIDWQKINAPYFADASLSVPAGYTLKIKPGVEIKFKGSPQIDINGTLEARGTAQNKIIFTGASGSTTGLSYLRFAASSVSSILEHAIVKYGGFFDLWGGIRRGAVRIDGFDLVVKDSVFENNGLAVELANNADFSSQSSNISIKNNEVGVYTTGNCPDLPSVSFGAGDDANTYNIYPTNCSP